MEVLFAWGPFKIYTLSVFVVLAFLWAAFVASKRAEEYHLEKTKVFDLSMVAFIFGGVAFKVLSLMWGSEWGLWYFLFGVIVGTVSFALWSKWNVFEVLDVVAGGTLLGFSVVFLGLFAAGGKWLDLASMAWFFGCFVFVFGLEYKYRFWEWYKGQGQGREGLGWCFMLVGLGLGRVYFEPYVAGVVLLLGLILIYIRSGRQFKKDFSWVLRRK